MTYMVKVLMLIIFGHENNVALESRKV